MLKNSTLLISSENMSLYWVKQGICGYALFKNQENIYPVDSLRAFLNREQQILESKQKWST